MDTTDKIKPIAIEDEIRNSYLDYAMSVIVGRALPDVRDGLKPVHRRILYAMRGLALLHNRPYKKSARVVGEVLGKYHPHGDTSVYDALVRMVQTFSLRFPLIDGQGNFGSVDGDGAAAMRYTESRLAALAEDVLEDLDKDTVDFVPNYDESESEPVVLPAKVPLLLMNGSSGIAVGMATNIPPHNLQELVLGIKAYLENRDISVKALMQYIPGPDFPTGAEICGRGEIERMYTTGRGLLTVKAKAEIQTLKAEKEQIIVTEIPYTVNKSDLIEKIADLVRDKIIPGISDIRDESDKDGLRIVIELKRSENASVILNQLYKHSNLQTTFGALVLALVDGRPQVMGLKTIFSYFIKHREEIIRRRTAYELKESEERSHILAGFLKALDHLDRVIQIIRASKDRIEAGVELKKEFLFSDEQIKAILDMRLYQLTGLERTKIQQEYDELQIRIAELKAILADPDKVIQIIKNELEEMAEKYSDARRTIITESDTDLITEDLIADEACVITVTHSGYIKRSTPDLYREQKRGGKGVTGIDMKDEDFVEMLFSARTHDTILFFSEKGQVFKLKVYELPDVSRTARGKALVNLLQIAAEEKIATLIKIRDFNDQESIVLATRHGVVKKSPLSEYAHIRKTGIQAINVDETDMVVGAKILTEQSEIVLVSKEGKSIRFHSQDLRDQGRTTRGVRGILLAEGDIVVGMAIVAADHTLLIACEYGYGKRTNFEEYRLQNRGGKGVITIRDLERNGKVVGALTVDDSMSIMMITSSGKLVRTGVAEISTIGRNTKGFRLIGLNEGDTLVDVCPIHEEVKAAEIIPESN